MAGLASILALLSGGGQAATQAPINDINQQNAQMGDPSNFMSILPVLQSSYGGQDNSAPTQPTPIPQAATGQAPSFGNIMPQTPQPGQPSVPMQRPVARPVAAPRPAPNPVAAPVNQNANAAQTNLNNSSLSALVPLLKNPQFQALTPVQKKLAVQTVLQLQQQQATQQRQALQDRLLQDRAQNEENTLDYESKHGGERPGTTKAPKSGGEKWSVQQQNYLDKRAAAAQTAFDNADHWYSGGDKAGLKKNADDTKKEAESYRKMRGKSGAAPAPSKSEEQPEAEKGWSIEPADESAEEE